MTKIKVQVDGGFPITLLADKYAIGSEKQGDGKFYPTLIVWGKVLFGKKDLWTFHAPICSWNILLST